MSLKDISALSPREILSRLFAQAAVDAVLAWLNKQLNPVQTSFAKPSISLCLSVSLFFFLKEISALSPCSAAMLVHLRAGSTPRLQPGVRPHGDGHLRQDPAC